MPRSSAARRPTMADVAREAGVSVMTVSYVFSRPQRVSPGVRELVAEVAERLNYHGPDPAARSLARGRSNSIGVVVGEGLIYAFDDFQSTRFLAGVAAVCVEYQHNLVLIPAAGDAGDVARVREANVDAYILWTGVRDGPVLDAIVATGKPVALQGPAPDSVLGAAGGAGVPQVQVVTADDRAAAAAVAATTFAGASVPAVVSFALSPDETPHIVRGPAVAEVAFAGARARLGGIEDACRRMGISWDEVAVAVVARNHRQDARDLLEELVGGASSPDAILAMSDELALGVLDVLDRHGRRVPDDVTVSGWDDSPAAAAHDLTSVHQSLEDQGTRCALLVLGQGGEPQGGDGGLVGDEGAVGEEGLVGDVASVSEGGQEDAPAWRLVPRGSTRRQPAGDHRGRNGADR